MTRQELIAKLKEYRANGTELQVKLTASTELLQAEYNRVFELNSTVQLPDCEFENQSVYDTSAQDAIDYANDCAKGICPVIKLPMLPEDEMLVQAWDNYEHIASNADIETTEEFMERKQFTADYFVDEVPFAWEESPSEIEEFRKLLDNSFLQYPEDTSSVFNLADYTIQTTKRIAKLSRDWCLRESRGFMSLFGNYTKLTTRTPRKVMRRASKFIADICKASKGLLHAQYTGGV